MINNVTLIGSGNLATQIGIAFKQSKITINQVYSKDIKNAKKLSGKLKCKFTNNIKEIEIKELGIICIKDDYISKIADKIPNKPIVHTSGSTNINTLNKFKKHGVIYPIQTLNKNKKANFTKIPICVEANTKLFEKELNVLCKKISNNVINVKSNKRLNIHIAAVMCNNFTNQIINRAEHILKKQNLSFEILLPIIDETFKKIQNPKTRLQKTGPAIRKDYKIIKKHIEELEGLDKKIYNIISKQIMSDE